MKKYNASSRRRFVRSSAFGLLSVPMVGIANTTTKKGKGFINDGELFYRYPSLDDTSVSAVVGAAHAHFDTVKKLVTNRPELANATWDWGFGDWESAIGAAAHMGRRDIVEFLMSHGARPDIFTYAMLGKINAVEAMVAATPGVQRQPGPHGITLLQHAKNRLRSKSIPNDDKANVERVVAFLNSLGDADVTAKSMDMTEEEQEIYLGEYRFGEKEGEIFEVVLGSRGMLQLGRKGTFGRTLNKISNHLFSPSGAPSVQVNFIVKDGQAFSLTVHEPEPLVTAQRI